ncbi:MAG: hypothetical protein ABF739_08065 [Acetobacter okinawensis]|uniref:hypothetical protein n=1 Tax=Acetobacter okinawensis TaxID=1076594 RepID=UPI0039E93401
MPHHKGKLFDPFCVSKFSTVFLHGDCGDCHGETGGWYGQGRHCLLGWSYSGLSDSDTVDLLTWGAIQKVTWGWLRSRIMEAHGLVWPQLTQASGLYPTGPDLDALRAQNVEFLNNDAR